MSINKDFFIGVWENKNVTDFSYDDELDITLYIGERLINISIIEKGKDTVSYFSNDYKIGDFSNNILELGLIESDLNDLKNFTLGIQMLNILEPHSYVVALKNFGKRFFVKK